jgi:hypothetical protein
MLVNTLAVANALEWPLIGTQTASRAYETLQAVMGGTPLPPGPANALDPQSEPQPEPQQRPAPSRLNIVV